MPRVLCAVSSLDVVFLFSLLGFVLSGAWFGLAMVLHD